MLLDDAVRQRQAEPEPPRLRGDEGVEDPVEQLGGDALALVRDLDLDQRPGPRADVDPPAEHGVEGQPRREREPPAAGHGLDPVLDEVLEHLDEPVRVGPERREARIVAADELDLVGAGRGLREEAHALQELVEVDAPEGEPQRAPEIEQRFHDAVDAVDLGEHDRHVLPERARAAQLVPEELRHAPDRAERVPDLVRERQRHLAQRREPLAPAHLRLEGPEPRQVPQHGDRAAEGAGRPVDRRRQHAHRDGAPVGRR